MKNPIMVIPGALKAAAELSTIAQRSGVPQRTLHLVHVRASQINGCSVCVDMHSRDARRAGESEERLFAVAAWREALSFTEAERAALALTEAATRVGDRPDPVPDAIWTEAARNYDEMGLASLVLNVALINFWNRINVPTRQPASARSQ
jgi:AhpD family alkylhydroperoxidase